jgi:lipoprotein-anchoring transpeptidase ErfK/SrfK
MSRLKIVVSLAEQVLKVDDAGQVLARFPVSTSRFGLGFLPGSLKTPTGNFRIFQKIGHDQPANTVFVGREPVTTSIDWINAPDLITSRILWLDGVDPENANTRERFIYIHGTNHEDEIGTPASHGCVRMRNEDVIALFDLVQPGDSVQIVV